MRHVVIDKIIVPQTLTTNLNSISTPEISVCIKKNDIDQIYIQLLVLVKDIRRFLAYDCGGTLFQNFILFIHCLFILLTV